MDLRPLHPLLPISVPLSLSAAPLPSQGFRTYSTRAQAVFTASLQNFPLLDIIRVITWRFVYTFIKLYALVQISTANTIVGTTVQQTSIPSTSSHLPHAWLLFTNLSYLEWEWSKNWMLFVTDGSSRCMFPICIPLPILCLFCCGSWPDVW